MTTSECDFAFIEAQRAQVLFRTWVDHSNDAFEVFDPETGRYCDFNETASSSLSYSREELLRLSIFDVDPTIDAGVWQEMVRQLREGNAVTHEGLGRRKDGQDYPVEATFRWVDTDRPYIVCVVRDITERQLAAYALRESEQRFRQLTESLPQLVWTCTPDGACNYLSPQWSAYVGDASGDLGFGWLQRVHEEDRAGLREAWRTAAREGEVFTREVRLAGRDGRFRWFQMQALPVRDAEGRVTKWFGTHTDITERIRGEEVRLHNAELEIENRKVQEANRLKSEFLANMSHELRTPLNGIIGFTEFLIDGRPGPLTPKQAEYLNDVYESSRHLLQLINDVLDLSKIEAGRMTLYPSSFPLRQAVEQVCGVIKGLAEKQKVTVDYAVSDELSDVWLDEQKFKQILFNLLSNAVKFTDAGGRAEIRAELLPEARFRLEVSDTGIGIKPEDFARLFREFEQLSSGVSRRFEGTGLGLALTRKLVELHGGEISVTSEIGRGTTFFVVLPLRCQVTE